jgi:hypothetical protein
MQQLHGFDEWLNDQAIKIKIAKRAKQATKKDNAAACLCFLNSLAFFRPAADRAVSILPLVVR